MFNMISKTCLTWYPKLLFALTWYVAYFLDILPPSLSSIGSPSSLNPRNRFGDKNVTLNHVSVTWGHKDGRKEIFLWDWVSVFWKLWVLYSSEHIPLTVSCQGSLHQPENYPTPVNFNAFYCSGMTTPGRIFQFLLRAQGYHILKGFSLAFQKSTLLS